MKPGLSPARIGIVNQPHVASDMPLKDEHMTPPSRRHLGSRRGPWEPQPVRREVQGGDYLAEQVQRRPAAAEPMGTARRPSADNLGRDFLDCVADRGGWLLRVSY